MRESKSILLDDSFNDILLDSINQTLSSLGLARRKKVFSYLEKELGVKKQDIPCRLDEFSRAIENVLGTQAFNYKTKLLIEIQKRSDEKMRLKTFDCLVPNLTFEDYIQFKEVLFLLTQKKSYGTHAKVCLQC
ncbi:MAG TPA: hypothetical protein VK536_00530 [Candidatus Limnocylindrales bacterium]|nr:hypothetical protein [Candidatus Limnocylindrales bacterium]